MKKIYTICFVSLSLLLSSCSFLNEEPSNAQNAEVAIQTVQDARVALNGILSSMTSSNYYGRNFMLYGDVRGGDFTIVSSGRGMDGLYLYSHTPTSSSCSYFWTQGFRCIMLANNLLENINRLEKEGQVGFDEYKGQALALRALFYFDLVRLYGAPYNYNKEALGVPLVTTTLDAQAQPSRATVEQNYQLIVADLEAAETLLKGAKKANPGYINYYAAKALHARVALFMDDYATALACAEEVIQCNVYSLYEPANWGRSWASQFGSESIFELAMTNENDLGTSSLAFYYMQYQRVKGASGFFLASDSYLQTLAEDAQDVRWEVMGEDELSTTDQPRLGAMYKYAGGVSMPGDGEASYTAVNVKIIRLSEVYLIAAEAALRTGDKATAVRYLNAIRSRAPQLAPATEETISLELILLERQKELLGEGQRFFDLIRCDKSITYNDDLGNVFVSFRPKTVDRTQFNTILPIAQDEINANPSLVSQQNPGY